ncbi:MAG TPA: serine/threonine-protein kinase [Vicinamibacterales bacterium]|nr:serine/threonine-protein kinase [Vicinamibacterales bacterium]
MFKQVGHYHILRQIGHGGMAVVFLAVDTRVNQQVALKLVQHGTDREAMEIVDAERFGAELQKRFSERGSHVPAVYDYGVDEDSGYFYVAMEYLDGENLSDLISHGPLPPARATAIGRDLARFLEDAHDFEAVVNGRNLQSLLHLDLKPRNVRITSKNKVKVLDFGTAKALSLSRKVTRNDFGSVAYLSPERLETGEVDARADLWALGVVLYEMIRGIPPFQATDTRRLERLILSRRPPPPLEGCPNGLAAIVAKLLDPRQSERYQTAREIRDDLERFGSGQRTLAEEQGWPARAVADDATRRTTDVVSGSSRTDSDDEKTRRTQPQRAGTFVPPLPASADAAPAKPPAPTAASKQPAEPKTRLPRSRTYRLVRAAIFVTLLGLLVSECSVSSEANRLASLAATHGFEQLPAAWEQYRDLRERSQLHWGIYRLGESLTDRTLTLADRVMANYRTPAPTVREAQWAAARDALALALASAGDDRRVRAALRYCEGHLHRINGEAQKQRAEGDSGQDELTEAVVAFREAAELRPQWLDPFLGLARTFILDLEEIELGVDALNRAQELAGQGGNGPWEMTDREWAMLGDGYRARGNSLIKSAGQLRDLPQERDYLSRAAEAYRLALSEYAKASGFGNVPQSIARTQRALQQVEETLGEGLTSVAEEAQ